MIVTPAGSDEDPAFFLSVSFPDTLLYHPAPCPYVVLNVTPHVFLNEVKDLIRRFP